MSPFGTAIVTSLTKSLARRGRVGDEPVVEPVIPSLQTEPFGVLQRRHHPLAHLLLGGVLRKQQRVEAGVRGGQQFRVPAGPLHAERPDRRLSTLTRAG